MKKRRASPPEWRICTAAPILLIDGFDAPRGTALARLDSRGVVLAVVSQHEALNLPSVESGSMHLSDETGVTSMTGRDGIDAHVEIVDTGRVIRLVDLHRCQIADTFLDEALERLVGVQDHHVAVTTVDGQPIGTRHSLMYSLM